MSLWRRSDDSIRWLVVIGLLEVLTAVTDLFQYGPRNQRWLQPLSLAVACLAAAPLEEPSRKGLRWQQKWRTPYGLVASAAVALFLALLLWSTVHGVRGRSPNSIALARGMAARPLRFAWPLPLSSGSAGGCGSFAASLNEMSG